MRISRAAALVVTASLLAACSRETPANREGPPGAGAPAARPAGERKYLLERVDDAAVVQLYADGFASLPLREKTLIWHLYQAAIAGRDIFYRPEAPRRARDARHPRADRRAPAGRRRRDARRDPALHQAVLDQQRALQQPDRAQVRAEDARRRRSPPREGGRDRTARPSRPPAGESLDAMLARLQPMFFDPNVDPIVTNKTPGAGQGHPAGERQQPLLRRQSMADLKGFTEKIRPQLAAGEARRQAGRGGLQDRRPLRAADRRDRASISRRRSRSRPSRWPTRCAR